MPSKWTKKSIAEKLGLKPEELDFEDLVSVDVHKALEAKMAQSQQTAQASMASKEAEINQLTQYIQSVNQQSVAQTGQLPDWHNDPLLAPIVPAYQQMVAEHKKLSENFGQAMQFMTQMYESGRREIEDLRLRELKREHADFDADKVRAFAKEKGLPAGISWNDAYMQMKAANMPSIIEEERKKAKEEALGEIGNRAERIAHVEMGESGGAGTEAPQKRSYKNAWDGLLKEFQSQQSVGF